MVCTLPLSPSFSASEVITSSESPRMSRLDQGFLAVIFLAVEVDLLLEVVLKAVEVGEEVGLVVAVLFGARQRVNESPVGESSPGCRPAPREQLGLQRSCSSLPFQTSCGSSEGSRG